MSAFCSCIPVLFLAVFETETKVRANGREIETESVCFLFMYSCGVVGGVWLLVFDTRARHRSLLRCLPPPKLTSAPTLARLTELRIACGSRAMMHEFVKRALLFALAPPAAELIVLRALAASKLAAFAAAVPATAAHFWRRRRYEIEHTTVVTVSTADPFGHGATADPFGRAGGAGPRPGLSRIDSGIRSGMY